MLMRKLFLFLFVSYKNPLNIDYTKEFYLRDYRIKEEYIKFAVMLVLEFSVTVTVLSIEPVDQPVKR